MILLDHSAQLVMGRIIFWFLFHMTPDAHRTEI